ncbi:glycosyltransferase family 4 protein [Pseudomonas sp. RAC1]|uniref:MraY family glycosyltransferase n=1 Tax=Pseudomonas sp. RAC1 TaxID=3064900 RepID=UPI0027250B95|nr:glycosyltransferase family 4 protein [Pseudomonas sp. RAC1]MDV9033941.1 glycosyltransferase family 4 protein [Pseudomonas sp. RAC1]
MILWTLFPAVLLVALVMTGGLRRYALARSIIDIPNERSSHSVPTPRGGGVAIVVAFLLSLPVFASQSLLPGNLIWALVGTGSMIALLGFLDDHGHVAARWRLLGHFLGSAWALFCLGGIPPLHAFGLDIDFGWFGYVLALFYFVWLLNLYNFMDGIDGLASVEAICVCLGGVVLYVISHHFEQSYAALALACAVAGFLFWNFPPARIFMGDAGSGFLGVALAILSLQAAWVDSALFAGWLILLGVFVVDATVTLIRRLLRGEKVYEAHRSHAYQHASRQLGSHKPVTMAVLLINVLWLFPLACMAVSGWLDGGVALVIAYLPLVLLAIKFRSGMPG